MALLAYYGLLLLCAFAWPTLRLWQTERINAFVLPKDDSAEGVIAIWFKFIIISLTLAVAASAFGLPSRMVGGLSWLEREWIKALGWGFLIVSFLLIVIAQAQMGRAWRIGIDHSNTPLLASHGLFRWSRNPIFLGLRLNLAGLFLALPNAATLAIMLLGEVLVQIQVRLEERHLADTFGAAYTEYSGKVRRWI